MCVFKKIKKNTSSNCRTSHSQYSITNGVVIILAWKLKGGFTCQRFWSRAFWNVESGIGITAAPPSACSERRRNDSAAARAVAASPTGSGRWGGCWVGASSWPILCLVWLGSCFCSALLCTTAHMATRAKHASLCNTRVVHVYIFHPWFILPQCHTYVALTRIVRFSNADVK